MGADTGLLTGEVSERTNTPPSSCILGQSSCDASLSLGTGGKRSPPFWLSRRSPPSSPPCALSSPGMWPCKLQANSLAPGPDTLQRPHPDSSLPAARLSGTASRHTISLVRPGGHWPTPCTLSILPAGFQSQLGVGLPSHGDPVPNPDGEVPRRAIRKAGKAWHPLHENDLASASRRQKRLLTRRCRGSANSLSSTCCVQLRYL